MLIGFMGTGKTTVGRLLAERTRRRFVDLDDLIVQAAGRPIPDIFKSQGEGGFRRLEQQALARALGERDMVIATGGGAACRDENLELMLAHGRVVALAASAEEVLRRTGSHSGRPLLDGASDPLQAARDLLAQREPFYQRAHISVDTAGKSAEQVAASVLAALAAEEQSVVESQGESS